MSNIDITPLIKTSLSLLEGNLNSSFADKLSNILCEQYINIPSLWKPSVDIIETISFFILYVCVPGVLSEDINIDFINDIVIIKGIRYLPNVNENIISRKQENIYSNFERRVNIPIIITKSSSVNIDLDNGILTIKIDKKLESNNKITMKPQKKNT